MIIPTLPPSRPVRAVSRAGGVLPLALSAGLCVAVLAGCGSSADDRATDAGDPSGAADPSGSTSTGSTGTSSDTPTSPSSSGTTSAATLPECSSIWVAKATLPQSYDGCADGSTTVPVDGHSCSFGGTLVTYDDRFYALTGHVVNELPHVSTSRQYRMALNECQA